MVVLSAAVCTKSGRPLIARQFVEMSRIRIEGLLAAFPKLMGPGNQQHTFIETDSVRYVYQPIENLFLLLITNKASNIVEDLETLRLLSKVVPDIAHGVTEEHIADKQFELVFAFDEVLTTGGHREHITLPQIQTNLSMQSHEEKLHKMIEASKVSSAKEEGDRKAKIIREQNRAVGMGGGSAMAGIGGGSLEGGSSGHGADDRNVFSEMGMSSDVGGSSSGGGVSSGGMGDYGGGYGSSSPRAEPSAPTVAPKGMKLGFGSKKQQMMDKLVTEDNLAPMPPSASTSASDAGAAAPPPTPVATHPVSIVVEERVNASMNREGGLNSLEIKGSMTLTANNDEACTCKVLLAGNKVPLFTYLTHPKVDKKAYEGDHVLALKKVGGVDKGFPKGKSVGVLRWSMTTADDEQIPLSINCWPEEDGDQMNVNVEFAMENPAYQLHNVVITIPLGTSASPNILEIGTGTHRHKSSSEELVWEIELIDQDNKNATLEFNIPQRDTEAFFPITVSFGSQKLVGSVAVANVVSSADDSPIPFGLTQRLLTDSYTVGE